LATPALIDFASRTLPRIWGPALRARGGAFDAPAIQRTFDAAERSVATRLLAALAREGRLPFDDQGSLWRIRLGDPRAGSPCMTVDLAIERRAAHGLHRWREVEGDGLPPLRALLRILAGALDELHDPRNAARIEHELVSSAIQLALARAAAPGRDRLRADAPHDPRACDPEHWIVDGHPWHPMSRMRSGLSLAAALRHAPEQLARAPVLALELPRSHVQCAATWCDAIAPLLGEPAGEAGSQEFVRVPVHIAQLQRLRADPHRAHLLKDAKLVDVPHGMRLRAAGLGSASALRTRSLASLRTVDTDRGLHLKLALDVHTTSTRRIVSPMSVANGPAITRLLGDILRRDPESGGFELMQEEATAGLDPAQFGPLAGEIGAILRPLPSARPAWICAALGDRVPGSDAIVPYDSLLATWAERYPGSTRSQRVRALLDAYVDAFFPWSLRLLVAHGIALELHLQNVLAVLDDDGHLACFRVRDLGGIRLHGPRLATAGHRPTFAPGSFTLTNDLAEVRDKWLHTLIHAHFGAVLGWGEALGADPEVGWARIREHIQGCLARWSSVEGERDAVREAALADRDALFAPRVRAKALLTMRLRQRSSDYDYVDVANALHDVNQAHSRDTGRR
jgi:siderophore synthetase component